MAGEPAFDPLCLAAAAKHRHPDSSHSSARRKELRGIDVVGSPEWQVARAKWLQERDERVQTERERQMRAKAAAEIDLHQRRAAAAERRRWLEAGRCGY